MRLALLLLMGAAVASAQNKMGLWSPLYYKLNPSRDDEYAKFIDSVSSNKCLARSFQGAILTGPTSRPPPLKNVLSPGQDARSDEYQRRFDYLYKAGDWQPFGYIYTDYGRRPLDAVLEDVDRWCDAINGYRRSVRGVFIDQVAEDLTCAPKDKVCLKDYYQKVVDAIRSKCSVLGVGDAMIMLNPGRSFNECKFMADNKIGFVNGWEDTYDTYQKFSAAKMIDCPCKDKGVRCVASIHSVPEDISQKQVEAVMTDMAANGFSAIFLTENKRPKQYETVPKIWPLTAQAACNVDAYVPKKRHMTRRLMKA